jgi:hypothetical protein
MYLGASKIKFVFSINFKDYSAPDPKLPLKLLGARYTLLDLDWFEICKLFTMYFRHISATQSINN